ncbi:TPA: histidinol-phosphate transaminase [Candidatus Sumerlaeota bacterium]|nr:histidinol-phosphate transaminase [Candidatus Sumerlaeota bacterium]
MPTPSPIRPYLLEMAGYTPGEQIAGVQIIKLNTNENPYPPAQSVVDAINNAARGLNLYPNATCIPLRKALAAYHGVQPENILVGNGSDEILRIIVHAFIGKGDTLGVVEPSYSLYPVLAQLFEGKTKFYALEGLERLPENVFNGPEPLFIIPNPTPPIGTLFTKAEIARLCRERAPRVVVVDEAYADFAQKDCISLLSEFSNLIITRTFSKSFSLAGLRVGYMIAHPDLINEFNKVKDSYNVNGLSQAAAGAAIAAYNEMRANAACIIATRDKTANTLQNMGYRVHESHGNFLFVVHPDAHKHYLALRERNILVRYFDLPSLRDGMRISMGTEEQMETVIAALKEII